MAPSPCAVVGFSWTGSHPGLAPDPRVGLAPLTPGPSQLLGASFALPAPPHQDHSSAVPGEHLQVFQGEHLVVPAGPPWRMCLHGHQGNPEVSKDQNAPPSHFRGLGAPCLPHHCHLLLLGHQACSSPHPQCCPNVEASCFRTSALLCRGCVGLGH